MIVRRFSEMTLVQKSRAEGKAVALTASIVGNAWGDETYLWVEHKHKHGTREKGRGTCWN